MSRFDDLFGQVAAPAMLEFLGHRGGVAYVKPDGQPGGRVDAMLEAEGIEEEADDSGRRARMTRRAVVRRRPRLPFWLDPPSIEGQIEVDDGDGPVRYAIEALEAVTETFATLRLARVAAVEVGRGGYRRR